jgi:hypothetical protein
VVAARERQPDALQQRQRGRQLARVGEPHDALGRDEHGEQAAGQRAEEDRGERREPQRRERHHDHRQEQDGRDVERAADRGHLVGRVEVARLAHQEEDRQRDRQRHARRDQRLADVRVEVHARSCGRQVGRIGQRRRLVAEVGARDHGAGSHGGVDLHAERDAHEADADRADHRPRAADAEREQRTDAQAVTRK